MPVKIFFCYAHEDEELLNKLKTHLRPLQRQGLIDVWYDRDISAGSDWEQEIKEQLHTAQIILLLVSPDFMDSDYINDVELKRAIERHNSGEARVIPIILRPVYWQDVLGKLQALPTDGKPIMSSSWQYQDEAFFNVTEGIRKTIKNIVPKLSPLLPPSSVETSTIGQSVSISQIQPRTEISTVDNHVSREQRQLVIQNQLAASLNAKLKPLDEIKNRYPFSLLIGAATGALSALIIYYIWQVGGYDVVITEIVALICPLTICLIVGFISSILAIKRSRVLLSNTVAGIIYVTLINILHVAYGIFGILISILIIPGCCLLGLFGFGLQRMFATDD